MYCPNCGVQNAKSVSRSLNCGNALGRISMSATDAPPEVDGGAAGGTAARSYLVWSIVLTALSFMLAFLTFALTVPAVFTGAAAIVFGALVDSRIGSGDHAGATRMSRWARALNWVTLGLLVAGVVVGALIFVLIFVAVSTAENSGL